MSPRAQFTPRTRSVRPPVEAVIFDLDGTLLDSAPQIAAAINMLLRAEGCEPFTAAGIAAHIGWGSRRLVETAFATRGVALEGEQISAREKLYLANYEDVAYSHITLYPDTRPTLEALARMGMTLGVCTNKAERISRGILDRAGIGPLFDVVVGGDSGFGLKPDPGPLDAARRKLGMTLARTLYVGDSHIDVATARALGAPVAIVRRPHGFRPDAGPPDHLLDDLVGVIPICSAG